MVRNHLTKEKYEIVKTNNNYNLGFMYVTKKVKNFEINDKENNQVRRVFAPADPLAKDFHRKHHCITPLLSNYTKTNPIGLLS